jgi:hypothetical protein
MIASKYPRSIGEVVEGSLTHRASCRSYYAVISVGNISFRVALDTGSADVWLISSACTSSACTVPKYQLGYHSPTFTSVNSNLTAFNVSYADGTGMSRKYFKLYSNLSWVPIAANGFVALETFQVGNLTVPGQGFGE